MMVILMAPKKAGYMDGYGCDSGGVCNIWSDVSLGNVVLSVYYWDGLQVGFVSVEDCWSAGADWSLDQIDHL